MRAKIGGTEPTTPGGAGSPATSVSRYPAAGRRPGEGGPLTGTLPPSASGRRVALSGLRGHPVVVVFNCGCEACNDFDRRLAAAAPRLRDAQVVAVTANPSAFEGRKLDQFRRATGFRWPILVDERMEATIR